MLWIVAILCSLVWLMAVATSNTMGGVLHVLLAVAIVAALAGLVRGRRGVGKAAPRRGSFKAYQRRK